MYVYQSEFVFRHGILGSVLFYSSSCQVFERVIHSLAFHCDTTSVLDVSMYIYARMRVGPSCRGVSRSKFVK